MPDWKRVIVGDSFRVPSRDPNYYRDILLAWPFLLFTLAAVDGLLGGGHNHRLGFKFAALSILSILLARERFALICGALGFCSVQSLLSFVLRHDWVGLPVAILTGTLFLLVIRGLRDYKPSYQWPKGMTLIDISVGLLSLGLTLLVFRWVS